MSKVEIAIKAIEDVFGDPSVSNEEAIKNLETLLSKIEFMLDSLGAGE